MSLKVSVKVKSNRLPGLSNRVSTKANDVAKESADFTAALARQLAPVDSGDLKSSISVEKDGDGYVVAPHTPYDIFVEFGTSDSPAQPFLTPASERGKNIFLNQSREVWKDAV